MSTTTERPVTEPTFEELAKRVDDAVAALGALDPSARKVAEELKAAIEQIHRAGLVTMVRRMRSDDPARDVLFELVDDPTVHLLLSLHGIVRPDPVTHANQVLVSVRPQLNSHGGDVTLVRVDDGTAYVRLEGACNGCSMSAVTLRNLVEEALVQGVPAISAVEVLPNEPTPTLIPIEALRIGRDPAGEGWVDLGPAAGLAVDDLSPLSVTTADGARAEVIV
ncbi:MAG: NifU family protein, partial [Mycolicibacterium aromaticivorans]|nr:NifU family protein [Mycolicibacterium aromaticivorans]